ncbi:MAG: Integrase family protein [Herminiimonas sp.]|nr:Integrase family protein [Herminiimonas sp.]
MPGIPTGVIQEFNLHASELWGRSPALGDTDERFCGSNKLYLPDGTFMTHAECPIAKVVTRQMAEVNYAELIIERPDGSRITVINSGVKNGEDRLVVLNDVAKSVVEAQRGLHPTWVFPYRGHALKQMNGSAWKKARVRAAGKW